MDAFWEILGRASLDSKFLASLSEKAKNQQMFFDQVNHTLKYRLSRVELEELRRLLEYSEFAENMRALGSLLRQALQKIPVPEIDYSTQATLKELRTLLGLSCIDEDLHGIYQSVGSEQELQQKLPEKNFHFHLSLEESEALFQTLGKDGPGRVHMHAIHDLWSPPNCISGLSRHDTYEHPIRGAVHQKKPGGGQDRR